MSTSRAKMAILAREVQVATGQSVTLAYADEGYTGNAPAQAAQDYGIDSQVVNIGHAKRSFVLLPRPLLVEHSLEQF